MIDNARRLVLRHRVRPIKVSLGAHPIEQKAKRGEAVGRCAPTQTELQKAKETASRLHCHWSPRREDEACFFFCSSLPRQAITANTARRLGRVIIGESDKPISPGTNASAFLDSSRAVRDSSLHHREDYFYIGTPLKKII